jgi:hypothetical protein
MGAFEKHLIISVGEGRKLVDGDLKNLPDHEIERIITLLESIARKTVQNGSINS